MNEMEEKIGYKVNERLVNFVIGVLGILLVIIGILGNETLGDDGKTIIISVGASLIASSVVTYLSSIYVFKRQNGKILTDIWGLVSIYSTRSEMNGSCDKYLQAASKKLDIIAFGLRSLRDANGKLVEQKVKGGMTVRILTINPNSEFLKQREIDEKKTPNSMANSIRQLEEWVVKLQGMAQDKSKVQLKYYDALPLDFYFREDERLYVGPYMYGKDSQQTISMEYRGGTKGFSYYTDYFEDLWNDSTFAKKYNEV